MSYPIWKDTFATLPSAADSASFAIRLSSTSGTVIYSGKAWKRPGETAISIRLNDVCADYLENTLPELSQTAFTALTLPLSFYVTYSYVNGGGTTVSGNAGPFTFYNDWSYDYGYDPAVNGMAFPIDARLQAGMWLVYTTPTASSVTATVNTSGGSYTVTIPIAISADFSADYNNDFARSVRGAGAGTIVIDPTAWTGVTSVTIGGVTYTMADTCAEWAVYYVNAYGGWDSLILEGNVSEKDTLTRYTREVEYDNRDIRNRGRRNFVNEITKTYTCRTGWLSDAASARMHHLLNSTDVYLFNIPADEMIPVTLPGTETPYKTHREDGMVRYEFDVQVAQNRTRR